MRRVAAIAMLAVLLGFGSVQARIWFVRSDGSGQAPTIQAGIDSSAAGDTVVAIAGFYTGAGNRDIDFAGKAIVVMAESSYDTTVADSSIIDGEHTYRGFYFHSGEDSSSVLEGFVIQRCNSREYWPDHMGAGILCLNASPTILNNVIRWCSTFEGGGIASLHSSPRIIGNRINSCYISMDGAGVLCRGGSPHIMGNEIFGNDCSMGGGAGVYCDSCFSMRIIGNSIHGNWGASNYYNSNLRKINAARRVYIQMPSWSVPGGVVLNECNGIIWDNAIYGNGGEIDAYNSTLTIEKNAISSNWSTCAAVSCHRSAAIIARNTISAADGSNRCGLGIDLMESLPSQIVGNLIGPGDADVEDLGAIQYGGSSESVIEGNVIHGHYGSGIRCSASIRIADNVIYGNYGSWHGGGIYCEGSPVIEGNTIVGNSSAQGAGIFCAAGSSPMIRRNIVVNNTGRFGGPGGEGIYSDSPSVTIECCDVFGNDGGNYVGIPDQTGLNGNFSANPIFCGVEDHDYSIHELSPCAPGNHPDDAECGLIGALGIGCYYIETLVQSYRARVEASAIVVSWELAKGADDLRFAVLRRDSPTGEYQECPERNITASGVSYSFTDDACEPGAKYRYRVDVIDEKGQRVLFETDAVSLPALPLTLHQNHPNPFNPSTTIRYYVPEETHVRLEIYDISGRRIAVLVDGEQEGGSHEAGWNGIDSNGNRVSSGVYFSRLTAASGSLSRKLILLR